ncbi:MAG: hypothetical protein WDM88_09340 [Galbitalea sp.]
MSNLEKHPEELDLVDERPTAPRVEILQPRDVPLGGPAGDVGSSDPAAGVRAA